MQQYLTWNLAEVKAFMNRTQESPFFFLVELIVCILSKSL